MLWNNPLCFSSDANIEMFCFVSVVLSVDVKDCFEAFVYAFAAEPLKAKQMSRLISISGLQ